MTFLPFSPRDARRRKSTPSSGHRRFQLRSLGHPRGIAWTQRHEAPLGNEKLSPPRRGVRQTICRLSSWCYMYVYRCGGSWCGDVVMWRGWGAHHKDHRRRKWWLSCRVVGELMYVRPLIGSTFGRNSGKLDRVARTRCYWPFQAKNRHDVTLANRRGPGV